MGIDVVALTLSGFQAGQVGVCSCQAGRVVVYSQGWFLVEQFSCLQMKQRRLWRQWLCLTGVMVEDPPISFSPFSLADCTLLEHFSFNDFVAIS